MPIPPYHPSGVCPDCPDCPDCPPAVIAAMTIDYDPAADLLTMSVPDADMTTVTDLLLNGGAPGSDFYFTSDMALGQFLVDGAHAMSIPNVVRDMFGGPYQINYILALDSSQHQPSAMFNGPDTHIAATPQSLVASAPAEHNVLIEGTGLSGVDSVRMVSDAGLDQTFYNPFLAHSGWNPGGTTTPQWNWDGIWISSTVLTAHVGDEINLIELRDYNGNVLATMNTHLVII